MTMLEQVDSFKEDLELFETPNEKLDYILDLAKNFKELPSELKNDTNIIRGCSSKAWLDKHVLGGRVMLQADGESLIARGMLSMLLAIFSNRTPQEILSFDPKELDRLGFGELLTPVRLQGLEAFLGVIYNYAKGV
jgi:cysteine desulfuration protein SufE